MLRGSLWGFSQTAMEGRAFSGCTACSEAVVGAYREVGWELVLGALHDPKTLERLTGLSELLAGMDGGAVDGAGSGGNWEAK